MSRPTPEILVTPDRLMPLAPAFSANAGGIVDFHGVVRGQEEAAQIAGIEYEAHVAMAEHQLAKLAAEAMERFPVLGLLIHHRIGFVPTAEPSLFLRVSAAHRGAAFDAAQWLIDELKSRVPIWKHPVACAAADDETMLSFAGSEMPDGQANRQAVETAP